MKKSDHYLKIVEWSEKDQCYVGTCPNLISRLVMLFTIIDSSTDRSKG